MSQNNGQSQRFCLRWNNHQSNLLAVFDQLLTSEAFVDVTLAVEGQMLRAHKMVLSACSPYFQTLFVGHPDRHPIVILKDVPLVDMRSLLDFMYRGEVSVDQDRLSAFLKVAESLRIKGLTEVNEDRGDLPSLASSLLQSHSSPSSSPVHNNQMAHVPQLQRIHNHSPLPMKRPLPSHPLHDQQRQHLSYPMNPLLGSALTAPKRKRGRPRKLSTGSNSPSRPNDNNNDDSRASTPVGTSAGSGRDPPDLLELNMSEESESAAAAPRNFDSPSQDDIADHEDMEEYTENGMEIKEEPIDPVPGTSQDLTTVKKEYETHSSMQLDQSACDMHNANMLKLLSSRTDNEHHHHLHQTADGGDRDNNNDTRLTLGASWSMLAADQKSKFSLAVSQHTSGYKQQLQAALDEEKRQMQESQQLHHHQQQQQHHHQQQQAAAAAAAAASLRTPPVKRRIRRRATSSSDPAEQLTEMSVRGLNLFRYATVSEGIYKCLECAKTDILKTFKNKYSFQRHAFLYHEGHQRKVFPCPVCAKEFSRPDKMKNHMKTVHECYMPKAIDFPQVPFLLPP